MYTASNFISLDRGAADMSSPRQKRQETVGCGRGRRRRVDKIPVLSILGSSGNTRRTVVRKDGVLS
nr:MAG TPA: hypothetical protein [Caudoviricetes sp.]